MTDPTEAALIAAIEADPSADAPYAVYGDWLEARGDPRGALIAMARALARDPDDAAMRAARDVHLDIHAAALLGPLASHAALVDDVMWRNGFVAACRVGLARDWTSGVGDRETVTEVIAALIDPRGPGRFLQHLTVGVVRRGEQSYQGVIDALAVRPRPTLRSLYLGDCNARDCRIDRARIGDCARLWSTVDGLRELVLRGTAMRLGAIDLPRLARLDIVTADLDDEVLRAVVDAAWPALTELRVCIGPASTLAIDALAPLLTGARMPWLRRLGICNANFTDALCDALVGAPVVERLDALDLSMGSMSDAGAAVLVRGATRLARVELNVHDNYLSLAGIAALQRAFPRLVIGTQRDGGQRLGSLAE